MNEWWFAVVVNGRSNEVDKNEDDTTQKIKRNLNETIIYGKNSIVIIYRLLLKYNIWADAREVLRTTPVSCEPNDASVKCCT